MGIGVDELAWDHSTFLKNRDRLLDDAVAALFLSMLMSQQKVKRLLSTDHFSVDGMLVQAWASRKSFEPVNEPDDPTQPSCGRNAETNFRSETRSNATHASTTDPDTNIYSKESDMARLPRPCADGDLQLSLV